MGGILSSCSEGETPQEDITSCGRSFEEECRPFACETEKLSPDLKLEIAKRSGLAGAACLSRVSKDWYEVTKGQDLWQSLYPSEVPHRISEDWRKLIAERSSLAKNLSKGAGGSETLTPESRIVAWQMQSRNSRLSGSGILRLVDALANAKRYAEAVDWFKKLESRDAGSLVCIDVDIWSYAERGHTPLLEAVLNSGHVHTDARHPTHGSTALMFAAQWGKLESLRLLISKGADITATVPKSRTGALDFALTSYRGPRSSPNFDIAQELIISGLPVDHRTKYGKTILMHAAEWGKLEMVWFLLHRGADANACVDGGFEEGGKSVLDFTISDSRRPHLHVLQALVLAGAAVDHRDLRWGSTSLMFAAQWGDVALARFLISRGANVHTESGKFGRTALEFALTFYRGKGPHFKVVEELIEAGVSVDATVRTEDVSGLTPLMIAAREGDIEGVTFLIDRAADVNLVDSIGNTALDYALVLHKGYVGPHCGVAYQLLAAGAAVERAKHRSKCADILY